MNLTISLIFAKCHGSKFILDAMRHKGSVNDGRRRTQKGKHCASTTLILLLPFACYLITDDRHYTLHFYHDLTPRLTLMILLVI